MFRLFRPTQSLLLTVFLVLAATETFAQQNNQASPTPQAFADEISAQMEAIRGLEFKKAISAQNQSLDDFSSYLDANRDLFAGDERLQHYGTVAKKLGLYRGEDIDDFFGLMKSVMLTQAGAYYNPETGGFYVVMDGLDPLTRGTIYSHELYHGLQDQYFDLNKYLLEVITSLSDDEAMARQAVVEGEATYAMTLWTFQKMTGSIPDRTMLAPAVQMQAGMDMSMLKQMMKAGPASQLLGSSEDMQQALEEMDKIPTFIMENLIGAYLQGMVFIYQIHAGGWEQVEQLYKERPPVSMEQILHPEKWLSNETPIKFSWPDFKALSDWQLLDANNIGEFQWRTIFTEHNIQKLQAHAAAAGWNGDKYAVLRKNNGDDLLLLLATSWDSEQDAQEFEQQYQALLKVKYPNNEVPSQVQRRSSDVFIVEGDEKAAMAFALKAETAK